MVAEWLEHSTWNRNSSVSSLHSGDHSGRTLSKSCACSCSVPSMMLCRKVMNFGRRAKYQIQLYLYYCNVNFGKVKYDLSNFTFVVYDLLDFGCIVSNCLWFWNAASLRSDHNNV